MRLLVVGLLYGLISPAVGQVNDYLSQQDLQRFSSLARSAIKKVVPEEVYFGTKLLLALGDRQGVTDSGVCDVASKLVSKYSGDPAAVGFGLATLKEAGCPISLGGSDAVVKAMLKNKAESTSFTVKYQALLANTVLNDAEIVPNMEAAVKQINKHRNDEGLFREQMDDSQGTTDNTFLMLELISASGITSKGIKKTIEKVANLLPGVGDEGGDASLISALAKASSEKLELSDRQLQATASSLLKMKTSPSAKTAYKVLSGLNTVSSYANAPVAVVMARSVLGSTGEAFQVEVKTLLGQPVEGKSVTIESVKMPANKKQETVSMKGRQLQSIGGGRYEGQIDAGPGLYDVHFIVGSIGNIARSVAIQTTADVDDIEVAISPSKNSLEGKVYHVNKNQGLAKGIEASSSEGHYVHVSYVVNSAVPPHQAFARFTHLGQNLDTYFASKVKEVDGKWRLTSVVSLGDEVENFFYHSGDYQLTLLVADSVYDRPIELNVGTLKLTFPVKAKVNYPLYKRPLLWDSDNALAALPEIHHQFRQPEVRPSPVVSAFFTGLVVMAFVFFLLYLPRVGANMKALPSGLGFLWSVAWLGSLSVILCLFTAYWVYLKGMTTLKYLFPVSTIAVFVGHQAFSYSAKSKSL